MTSQVQKGAVPGVISYIAENLPKQAKGGWADMALSAYQMGCMALIALGQASQTPWGAAPQTPAVLPDKLPRWDDICVVVLALAQQQGRLSYRLPDGSLPQGNGALMITALNAPAPPAPNILPAHGLGPAWVDAETVGLLAALGLIGADQIWTDQAETILWRIQPRAWSLSIPSDPRFKAAVTRAIDTLPPDHRNTVDRLATITDADVSAHLQTQLDAQALARAKHGPAARLAPAMTEDQARRSLEFLRRHDLNGLFFRHWRLPDGWLTEEGRANALQIFHDPLAIQIRKAVIAQLHPENPTFAE